MDLASRLVNSIRTFADDPESINLLFREFEPEIDSCSELEYLFIIIFTDHSCILQNNNIFHYFPNVTTLYQYLTSTKGIYECKISSELQKGLATLSIS